MKVLKRINKVKAAELKAGNDSSSAVEIRFENLGGGIDAQVIAFDDIFENQEHLISFNCFSSGSVEFVRKITDDEMKKYNEVKELRSAGKLKDSDVKKYPSYQIKQEARKMFINEIYKAAQEFDKKIADIAKKHGYKKK